MSHNDGRKGALKAAFVTFDDVAPQVSHQSYRMETEKRSTKLSVTYTGNDSDLSVSSELAKSLKRSDKEPEVVSDFMPFYSFSLLKLSSDDVWRVREGLGQILLILIETERKTLTPFMKELIGPWIQLLNDPSPEVSRIFSQCLEMAIPMKRRVTALGHLAPSIIKHLQKQLSSSLQDIITQNPSISHDDAEEVYDQTISSCIKAVGYLVISLNAEQNQRLLEGVIDTANAGGNGAISISYQDLFTESCLLKHFSSKRINVQLSLVKLFKTMAESLPSLLEVHIDEIRSLLLASFSLLVQSFPDETFLSLVTICSKLPKVWEKPGWPIDLLQKIKGTVLTKDFIGVDYLLPIMASSIGNKISVYVSDGENESKPSKIFQAVLSILQGISHITLSTSSQSTTATTSAPAKLLVCSHASSLVMQTATYFLLYEDSLKKNSSQASSSSTTPTTINSNSAQQILHSTKFSSLVEVALQSFFHCLQLSSLVPVNSSSASVVSLAKNVSLLVRAFMNDQIVKQEQWHELFWGKLELLLLEGSRDSNYGTNTGNIFDTMKCFVMIVVATSLSYDKPLIHNPLYSLLRKIVDNLSKYEVDSDEHMRFKRLSTFVDIMEIVVKKDNFTMKNELIVHFNHALSAWLPYMIDRMSIVKISEKGGSGDAVSNPSSDDYAAIWYKLIALLTADHHSSIDGQYLVSICCQSKRLLPLSYLLGCAEVAPFLLNHIEEIDSICLALLSEDRSSATLITDYEVELSVADIRFKVEFLAKVLVAFPSTIEVDLIQRSIQCMQRQRLSHEAHQTDHVALWFLLTMVQYKLQVKSVDEGNAFFEQLLQISDISLLSSLTELISGERESNNSGKISRKNSEENVVVVIDSWAACSHHLIPRLTCNNLLAVLQSICNRFEALPPDPSNLVSLACLFREYCRILPSSKEGISSTAISFDRDEELPQLPVLKIKQPSFWHELLSHAHDNTSNRLILQYSTCFVHCLHNLSKDELDRFIVDDSSLLYSLLKYCYTIAQVSRQDDVIAASEVIYKLIVDGIERRATVDDAVYFNILQEMKRKGMDNDEEFVGCLLTMISNLRTKHSKQEELSSTRPLNFPILDKLDLKTKQQRILYVQKNKEVDVPTSSPTISFTSKPGSIVATHLDNGSNDPFFTIQLDDGHELQTSWSRLLLVEDGLDQRVVDSVEVLQEGTSDSLSYTSNPPSLSVTIQNLYMNLNSLSHTAAGKKDEGITEVHILLRELQFLLTLSHSLPEDVVCRIRGLIRFLILESSQYHLAAKCLDSIFSSCISPYHQQRIIGQGYWLMEIVERFYNKLMLATTSGTTLAVRLTYDRDLLVDILKIFTNLLQFVTIPLLIEVTQLKLIHYLLKASNADTKVMSVFLQPVIRLLKLIWGYQSQFLFDNNSLASKDGCVSSSEVNHVIWEAKLFTILVRILVKDGEYGNYRLTIETEYDLLLAIHFCLLAKSQQNMQELLRLSDFPKEIYTVLLQKSFSLEVESALESSTRKNLMIQTRRLVCTKLLNVYFALLLVAKEINSFADESNELGDDDADMTADQSLAVSAGTIRSLLGDVFLSIFENQFSQFMSSSIQQGKVQRSESYIDNGSVEDSQDAEENGESLYNFQGSKSLNNLLLWICSLQAVDTYASHNHQNGVTFRSQFGNYSKLTGRFSRIMDFLLSSIGDISKIKESYLLSIFQHCSFVIPDHISKNIVVTPLCGILQGLLERDKHTLLTKTYSEEVASQLLAVYGLCRTICVFPALTRYYWMENHNRFLKSKLSKFIEQKMRHLILHREMGIVQSAVATHQWDPDTFHVGTNVQTGELTATIFKDESQVTMTIKIPLAFPLMNVEVNCSHRIGVSEGRWRRWVLQMIQLLSTQDGTIMDAAIMWKANVDHELKGVEPCPICYSTLQMKTLKLPTFACPTCHNKFHPTCLQHWFKTSAKNKCVICQQPIFL